MGVNFLYPYVSKANHLRQKERGQRNGALGEIRTHGLCLRRAALYPLSYKRTMGAVVPALLALVPREGFEPTHP